MSEVLQATGLVKSYGANNVLTGVDLTVEAGQVMALLGPNGAGKSTLINCLSGGVAPDAGTVRLQGVDTTGQSPAQVRNAGLAVIYQSFSLIEALSIADNVFLGHEITKAGKIDHKRQRRVTDDLLSTLGVPARSTDIVGELPIGVRQMVELSKAVHDEAGVLILDEPTAALSDREVTVLLDFVRRLANDGVAVVYVSHRLEEILDIADHVTVLRDGVVVDSSPIGEHSLATLASAISPGVGETGSDRQARPHSGKALLSTSDLQTPGAGPFDLKVAEGEIVGLFGLLGAGRTELVEALVGARPRTGTVTIDGTALKPHDIRTAIANGMFLVAGDRKTDGLFDSMSIRENVVLPHLHSLARGLIRRRPTEAEQFSSVADTLNIVPNVPSLPASAMSGGNQQKLVLGRWLLSEDLRILVLDEPTKGVDVSVRQDLYAHLQKLADSGVGIVFTSSEPTEIFELADRVVVMSSGLATLDALIADTTSEELLRAAQTTSQPDAA